MAIVSLQLLIIKNVLSMKKLITLLLSMLVIYNNNAQVSLTEAVDFTVTDLHGEEHNLFDILDQDKYVMIDLFAYWCGPCCDTAPKIKKTYEDYGCNMGDLFVIGIEGDGTTAQTEEFENECGSAGAQPVVSGLDGGGSEVVDTYNPQALPTIILIAPDRTIVEQDIWPYNNSDVEILLAGYDIDKQECDIVDVEELSQVNAIYLTPNPVQDEATLNIDISESADLVVEILNITGKLVSQNNLGHHPAGKHQITLYAAHLVTGTYLVRISIDGHMAEAIKMNKI